VDQVRGTNLRQTIRMPHAPGGPSETHRLTARHLRRTRVCRRCSGRDFIKLLWYQLPTRWNDERNYKRAI